MTAIFSLGLVSTPPMEDNERHPDCYACVKMHHTCEKHGNKVVSRRVTLYYFEITEEEFGEMYREKYRKEPSAEDYDRFCEHFDRNSEHSQSNAETVTALLLQDACAALEDLGQEPAAAAAAAAAVTVSNGE